MSKYVLMPGPNVGVIVDENGNYIDHYEKGSFQKIMLFNSKADALDYAYENDIYVSAPKGDGDFSIFIIDKEFLEDFMVYNYAIEGLNPDTVYTNDLRTFIELYDYDDDGNDKYIKWKPFIKKQLIHDAEKFGDVFLSLDSRIKDIINDDKV